MQKYTPLTYAMYAYKFNSTSTTLYTTQKFSIINYIIYYVINIFMNLNLGNFCIVNSDCVGYIQFLINYVIENILPLYTYVVKSVIEICQ
jgi:hypothetical protein